MADSRWGQALVAGAGDSRESLRHQPWKGTFMKKLWVLAAAVVVIGAGCVAPPPAPKDCTLRGPGVDLRGCDLRGVTFIGQWSPYDEEWTVLDMSGARLDGANLQGAFFGQGVNFNGASFRGADLNGSTYSRDLVAKVETQFSDVDFTGASLVGATLDTFEIAGNFSRADLRNMGLMEAGLEGTFVDANLSGSAFGFSGRVTGDLRRANLSNTTFGTSVGPDLRGANFTGARFELEGQPFGDASGATFDGAVFSTEVRDTNFEGASFVGMRSEGTNWINVNFSEADFTAAAFVAGPFGAPNTFTNVTWFNTTCPNGVVQSTPCV